MSTNMEKAEDIIKKHQKDAPVLVSAVAKEMGLDVIKIEVWPHNISGMLKKQKDNKFVIYVNGNHSKVRRRFTIAHEIAHFILHRHLISKINNQLVDDTLYRSGLNSIYESAANRFAADILMPWSLVNKAIDSGVSEIEELAKRFNVSKSAISIRLGVPFE